eukprot:5309843-Alexandrium_andersonii.AAC.1
MLGMLTILLAPARRIMVEVPSATPSLFADVRTAVADTAQDMDRIEQIWVLLEKATTLKNNAAKQKDWSYNPPEGGRPAAFLGEAPTVLGAGLPALVRTVTDKEASKTRAAAHQLRRVGSLPLPAKLRRLASATGPL